MTSHARDSRTKIVWPFSQFPMLSMVACQLCGCLLMDVERHFETMHKKETSRDRTAQ